MSPLSTPFDVEYLKSILNGAGYKNEADFVADFNQRYPQSGLTLPVLITAFKFGIMNRNLLTDIAAFLDLNKDQFVKLIKGDGLI